MHAFSQVKELLVSIVKPHHLIMFLYTEIVDTDAIPGVHR
jgi:hypothetical protein